MSRVTVVGGESTGGRLVARLLSADEDLQVKQWSFPYGPRSQGTTWPFQDIAEWNAEYYVVTVRDWDASIRSKLIHHQPDFRLAELEHQKAYELLFCFFNNAGVNWRFLVYESLVADPENALRRLFLWLGRPYLPPCEPIYDGNAARAE